MSRRTCAPYGWPRRSRESEADRLDAIKIRGLRVDAHVGVTDEERSQPQTIVVNVHISADLERASMSDDLEDTIDYAAAATAVAERIASQQSKLLEHLAGGIADDLLSLTGVRGVTVEIAKEPPPLEEDVETVAVTIERLPR